MTDTDLISTPAPEAAPAADAPARGGRSRGTGLNAMVLTELRQLAGELGIRGTSGMRKGDLVAAIAARQSTGSSAAPTNGNGGSRTAPTTADAPAASTPAGDESRGRDGDRPVRERDGASQKDSGSAGDTRDDDTRESARGDGEDRPQRTRERGQRRGEQRGDQSRDQGGDNQRTRERGDGSRGENRENNRDGNRGENRENNRDGGRGENNRDGGNRDNQGRGDNNRGDGNRGDGNRGDGNRADGNRSDRGDGNQGRGGQNGPRGGGNDRQEDDGEGGGRGRRGRRFRERRRGRDREGGNDAEPQISDDDVLQPVAGILDVLDNYAFVRTSGYLAGPNDVYVSMNLVRKNGLRRGDAITGAVKLPRDGEQNNQRQKFNPLVRLDTVNGGDVEAARKRPEFGKLTPLYPNERLRLETTPERLSTRVIDLIMPIGKGQRALIVSPPKAGKTTILQDIANAISINNPECHLMVVLVDERPEEVTDMTRSVKGEVIASTFDRPPSDHTSVAELAIERAKRVVESGKDVVVLLDSITRLGRAYNNASPASGRILSGGVDSTALYPPKRFLGAARNIENGGSLTIIASALVETGSTGDTVIFEEFKGTGNAELKLDRKISERRVFPAVDVNLSSTRKDELMMSADEFAIVHKLRRLLSGLDSQAAIDLLISQLRKSKTNIEFLMQVQKNAPGQLTED
ncbi:transcription termination factor Rho [Williamsia serinedens]|uniref:Transcription termination factor Rho n=1 Tax=Williamsia serinedens TaxID=391736 RepID=A0ABT1H6W2_9NOCA|nr:transcription termination factor Rho [Williamsia serinedens]MCP2162896.1 transcription termination factor Rho [Williamsia serinedens]